MPYTIAIHGIKYYICGAGLVELASPSCNWINSSFFCNITYYIFKMTVLSMVVVWFEHSSVLMEIWLPPLP